MIREIEKVVINLGVRQREKSDMTKNELNEAMLRLFIEKGYENTSVKDITDAVGYAVGSFYRHWKSKQQAFMECCNQYVSEFIRQSVENAPLNGTPQQMADYLVQRSEEFSRNEKTVKLYVACRAFSAVYPYEGVEPWAERYTEMLYVFVRRVTGCEDTQKLNSVAGILHTVLDTHALQYTDMAVPHFTIDSDTLRGCLVALILYLKPKNYPDTMTKI